jgi:hypothetical protein
MYNGCPFAYKLVNIDRVPRAASEALLIGRQSHDLAADYLNRLISQDLRTDWEWAEAVFLPEGPADVADIWERFYANFILPGVMVSPGVELKLAFNRQWQPTGYFDPDVYFRMVIDFCYQQDYLAVVQDWKTNWMIPETVSKNLQLRIYGWGAMSLYPQVEEILLRLHFLRYGLNKEIMLYPQDLIGVPELIEDKINQIEKDKRFEPTPGSFCGMCGVTAHCPVMANALVPVNILYPSTREEAEKTATLLLAIRTMNKELTANLKAYTEELGPVRVGDMIYGPKETENYELDPKTITEQIIAVIGEENKENAWGVLSVTKTNLEKGLRKLGQKELLKGILAMAPTKPSYEVKFQKAKD